MCNGGNAPLLSNHVLTDFFASCVESAYVTHLSTTCLLVSVQRPAQGLVNRWPVVHRQFALVALAAVP